MAFDDADDHILTAATPAYALAQHAEGFTDTRSVAKKTSKRPRLLVAAGLQLVFRCLARGCLSVVHA